MPRQYSFVQLDVFTDRVFGGNQLAVFLQPDGLSETEMQAIAGEMNLAETTFVFPPTRPDCVARVRIFTPRLELPFAGHPTVGTAWVLATTGRFASREVNLEEQIGAVPVRVEGELSAPASVWMTQRDAHFGEPVSNRADVAAALGLHESDLIPDKPIYSGSTGIPHLFIPLRTPEIVDRASVDLPAMSRAFTGERVGVFIFAPDPQRGTARVYSRMFAGDTVGVPEDAATGSASGPLGAYLAEHGMVDTREPIEIVSLQGNKMGRPSLIHIRLRLVNGRAAGIEVGGGVVPAMEGVLSLPT